MRRWSIAMLALGAIIACSGQAADQTRAAPSTAAEPPAAVAEQPVVYVDVRTPEEFASGHVEGAINIPHTEMEQRLGELEAYRDAPIVLYCRSGRRAGIAQGILEGAGFRNVENAGGLADLERQGVPTTR